MAVRSFSTALVGRFALASALALSVLASSTPAQAVSNPVGDLLCVVTSLTKPVRLADALDAGLSGAPVATTSARSSATRSATPSG